jgi:hypothetical protein
MKEDRFLGISFGCLFWLMAFVIGILFWWGILKLIF